MQPIYYLGVCIGAQTFYQLSKRSFVGVLNGLKVEALGQMRANSQAQWGVQSQLSFGIK